MSNLRSYRTIREGNFCPALFKADDTDPKAKRLLRQLCLPNFLEPALVWSHGK